MAASVTIEIPVSVVDKTGGVLGQIQNKLTRLEQAAQKVSKIMMGGTAKESGIEKAMRKMDDTLNKKHSVEITAEDNATGVISDVEDALHRASGMSADIDIGANDMATDVINDAMDSVSQFSGTSGEADIEANDMASDIILAANNTLDSFNGNSGVADITANDMASDIIVSAISEVEAFNGEMGMATLEVNSQVADVVHSAMGSINEFDGSHGIGQIEVEDTATDVTMNAVNAVQEFDGSHGTATLDVVDNATAAINQAEARVKGFAGKAMAATGAALGASVGFNDAINTYKDFEYTMSQVRAISGASESEYQGLVDSAQYYGANTMFTATEAGEAFKYMGMAGWSADEMQSGIGAILNLAGASGEDLGKVSDIVTDALTAFGYKATDAAHFSDVLAQAATSSNTNVGLMGETFKYVGTMAGTLGYTAEDAAVAIGAMANAGLKGSMAGTSLNMILTKLSETGGEAQNAIKELGIDFFNADGSARPFLDVMTEMREATKDFSSEEMANFANTVAGLEAQKGLQSILKLDSADWDSLVSDIYNSEGAAEEMLRIMMNNLQGDMFYFTSALDGVKMTLGRRVTPYLRDAIQSITDVLPDASNAIEGYMNKVDLMTSTQEWKGADTLGKMNIAWDTMIAKPFSQWAGGTGKNLFAKGLTTLFTSAGKVVLGQGKATDWMGTALLGAGAIKGISTVKNLMTGLGSLSTAVSGLGGVGAAIGGIASGAAAALPAIAAVAAGVVAIGSAIHTVNQAQISESLAQHFGNIELSAQQAAQVASSVLGATWTTNVQLALGEISGAEELRTQAENSLRESEAIIYNAHVRTEMQMEAGLDPYLIAFGQTLQDEVTAYAESNHIPYNALADVALNPSPDGGGQTMQAVIDYANEFVASASEETLSEIYEGKVGVELTPEQEGEFCAQIEDAINADIKASAEANDYPYDDSVKITLKPEESGDMLATVKSLIESKVQEKMSPTPKYEQQVLAVLKPEEQADYKSEIEKFIDDSISALEKTTKSAHILVKTFLKSEDGQTLSQKISEWATEDQIELGNLSSQLTDAVDQALSDGIMTVNEAEHISELQNKINSIMTGWKEAEAQAQTDLLSQKIQGLTGKELSAGAFESVVSSMQEQRAANEEYLDQASLEFYSMVNALNNSGRLAQAGLSAESLKNEWGQAMRNASGESLMNSLNFEGSTIGGAYSDLVAGNIAQNQQAAADMVNRMSSEFASGVGADQMLNMFETLGANLFTDSGFWASGDQKSLASLYKLMQPDVGDMAGLIDQYRELGQKVPQELMDSYNSAMELGAASGDASAGWAVFANELVRSGNEEFIQAIQEGTAGAPEELRTALERAMTETTSEPISIDDVKAKVDGVEVTGESEAAVQQALEEFASSLTSAGGDIEITQEGVKVKFGELDVDAGQLAEALGMTLDELTSSLGMTEAEIEAAAEVTIPADAVNVDTAQITSAIENAATESAGTAQMTADANVEAGNVDTSSVVETVNKEIENIGTELGEVTAQTQVVVESASTDASAAASEVEASTQEQMPESVPANTTATVTVNPGTVEAQGVYDDAKTQVEALLQSLPAEGTVAVTLTKESDNIAEIYSQCDSEIQSAFSQTFNPNGNVDVHLTQTNNRDAIYSEANGQIQGTFAQGFTASANVAVTLNWSITNPSASISTSSSGSSVHASIGASAEGRYVDNAMLSWIGEDGPEYVIPVGAKRHARGMDLWMQAGKALGVDLDAIPKFAEGGLVGATSAADASDWIGDQTWASQGDEATMKDDGSIPSIIENSKKNITVQVNVSPSFSMTEIDENDILSTIRFHMKEIADEVGAEIADTIGEAFENRPIAN